MHIILFLLTLPCWVLIIIMMAVIYLALLPALVVIYIYESLCESE